MGNLWKNQTAGAYRYPSIGTNMSAERVLCYLINQEYKNLVELLDKARKKSQTNKNLRQDMGTERIQR